jgi:hypothetical protein
VEELMPTNRRFVRRANVVSLTDQRLHYLATGETEGKGFRVIYSLEKPTLAQLWAEHGQKITRAHIKKNPCSRPPGWWLFDCPQNYRRIVNGSGGGDMGPTPPDSRSWDHIQDFEWIDPDNPPLVESEASYLARHGVLTQAEKNHLKRNPKLRRPIRRPAFDAGYPYDWRKGAEL